MKTWVKETPIGGIPQGQQLETWQYFDRGERVASFEVAVTLGKPLDVLGLKGANLQEAREYSRFLSETALELYGPDQARRGVANCPCCHADTSEVVEAFTVFEVAYVRCHQCGHSFVLNQPAPETLNRVFIESDEYAIDYTDPDSLELRLAQVVGPKLAWLAQVYRQHWGKELESALDVGAGGGHFVEICRRAGLRAEGYEINHSATRFARKVFGIDLRSDDFLKLAPPSEEFDVITFWGLLEYISRPRDFLEAAHRHLRPDGGMLLIEVPRFDCFGTAVQRELPQTLTRHAVPTSHLNLFSDGSMATALWECGFQPVAAWYYGMDVYELLTQLALHREDPTLVEQLAPLIPGLQASLDSARLCDDLVVAAVPRA